jgi:glycosidase
MTPQWTKNAVFYHIYPLGLCGAPKQNDFSGNVTRRLPQLDPWIDHIQSLGCNALYLGPVFQSSTHGYDTVDYYHIDSRLGDLDAMVRFAEKLHNRKIKLVLDGVFNHVGRDFWAFKDVLQHGESSNFTTWFQNLRFGEQNSMGDPFQYEGWQGHQSLVKLNLSNPDVRAHLFDAVGMWINKFGIDGLRLDAADCIDFDFLRALHDFTINRRDDFWLMGEVVHGDYREWANPQTLDSVTNYEAYKGLYSSLKDANYFEIAYSLARQFGPKGIYRDLWLYNFVDNHDVDRVASQLDHPSQLFVLYLLLFTMPGIPSIYYGSEWGIKGTKSEWSDATLRPALDLNEISKTAPQPELPAFIKRLADIHQSSNALRLGTYQEVLVDHEQFVFQREHPDEIMIVVLNSASQSETIKFSVSWDSGTLSDLLEPDYRVTINQGQVEVNLLAGRGRLLIRTSD